MNPEQEAQLLALRKKTIDSAPIEEQTAEPESTAATTQAEPKEGLPKETPSEKSPETEQPLVEETKTTEASWDADSEETTTTPVTTPSIEWAKVGSAIGLEIKEEKDLVEHVSKIKSELKALQEAPLSGVSDEFKEVIKVAQSGEDWRDYLAQQLVDYTKVDAIQLYEDEFYRDAVRNPRYQTDGKYDPVKADEAINAMPDALLESLGKQMQYGFIQNQRQRQAEIKAKAQARLDQADQALNSATKNLGEILPVEAYGIKFEPKHSTEIYSGITNSKLTKKHLGLSYEQLVNNGADLKSVVRSITLAEKGEKMIAFKSKNSKAEAKAEILQTTQNVQLKGQSSIVNPEDPEKKVISPKEKLEKWYASQNKGL